MRLFDLAGVQEFAVGAPGFAAQFPAVGLVRFYRGGGSGHPFATAFADAGDAGFGIDCDAAGDLDVDGSPDMVAMTAGLNQSTMVLGSVRATSLAPGLQQFGTGTPGCGGLQHVNLRNPAAIGASPFVFTTSGAPPLALGLLLITDAVQTSGFDPFGLGVLFYVDLPSTIQFSYADMSSDAAGFGLAQVPTPVDPQLAGIDFYALSLWHWPGPCTPSIYSQSSSEALKVKLY